MDLLDSVAQSGQKSQINTYLVYVNTLGNVSKTDDVKLRAAQEISENLDLIILLPQYPMFLARFMKIVKPILLDVGGIQFISEYNIHQTRKVILEILYRLPTDEYLKPYITDILKITLKLLEIENEENSLICLQIMSEYRKKFKPIAYKEVLQFLQFVKKMFDEFTTNYVEVIQAKSSITIKNLVNFNIESTLTKTFIITAIHTNEKDEDGNLITYNLIPRAKLSLKFLQKVPLFLMTLRLLYKQHISDILLEIFALIIKFITLKTCDEILNCNREILFEFVGVQIKCLMIVAYNMKDFIDIIFETGAALFKGIVDLLRACPTEATHFRKEIFIYFRYFIVSKFQRHFLPHIDQLLDEEHLFGSGYTANEILRPFVFNVIGDFIHQVRHILSFSHLTKVVNFFSKILNDSRLPANVENLSCKILNNLIECVKSRSESEDLIKGRKVLQKMLEIFILKLETIVKDVIPIFTNAKTLTRTSQNLHQNIVEYKNIIKWIILGVQEIVIFNFSDKFVKLFESNDMLLLSRFLKWGMESLNLYMIGRLAMDAIPKKTNKLIQFHEAKLKEEKQLLENFATIFMSMDSLTFHKIFTSEIDFIVNQVIKNREFLAIINYLLLDQGKSLVFGTIMIEYLLEKMDQVGSNHVISELYLTLFKTIFGSVAFSPEENKEILRSNLHKIVKRSLDLAVNAKEPLNYFLILRSLYRSISGRSEEMLYQEFLPLLAKLIEDLNRFQTESHKQEIQEILLELFLSIPVKIGFLLPYLEKLMMTIVHALNGNDVLISDGLRILDICINSLEFSFFQDYLQIVATDLIQSLYRIVRESNDEISQKAFEILGKLGGENRKVLMCPQKLKFVDRKMNYPSIGISFGNSTISLSVKNIIDTAFSTLNSDVDLFYKQQSWRVINSYLSATIKIEDDEKTLSNLFDQTKYRGEISKTLCYIKEDVIAREVQKIALCGMFIAAAEEISLDFDQSVFETMISYVRHYTMIIVAREICLHKEEDEERILNGQNPLVLIDALRDILKHEKKEFFKVAFHILETIFKTAISIVGSLERVCQLPFMEYLCEKMTSLCYENPWYSKLGGCMVIEFLMQKIPVKWLLIHLIVFVKGLIFVITDLNEGIGNGTISEAKRNLEKLLRVCFEKTKSNSETIDSQNELNDLENNMINAVTRELLLLITCPRTIIRKEAIKLLFLLAEIRKVTITKIIGPQREILMDVIPPMKHRMTHHPVDVQIGVMDGNAFCMSQAPSLFFLDSSVNEHMIFYNDLVQIIERDDNQLSREPCYEDNTDFIPLKISALRAFTHFFSIKTLQDSVLQILINNLKHSNLQIQETALECLKKLSSILQLNEKIMSKFVEPLLNNREIIDLKFLTHFSYLVEIVPMSNDQFCNSLIIYLGTCLKNLKTEHANRKIKEEIDGKMKIELDKKIRELEKKVMLDESEKQSFAESERRMMEESKRRNTEEKQKNIETLNDIVQQILKIIEIFQKTSVDLEKFIPTLCRFFLQSEKDLMNQILNPFHLSFARYLTRYPASTVDFLLNHDSIRNEEYGLFLEFILQIEEGTVFKETLKNRSIRLMQMFLAPTQTDLKLSKEDKFEIRFRAIRIVSILIDSDEKWLMSQNQLTTVIKQIWYRNEYINHHKDIENVKSSHLIEPKLLLKVFIHYLKNNCDDYDFLFNILKIFRINFVSDVTILSDFLEKIVAQTYDIQWKRKAFSKFLGNYQGKKVSDDLKADILQYIVHKCFEASFKKGETLELIGSPPSPDTDDPRNLISIFVNKIIDIDNPGSLSDRLRVSIFRFSCLLIDHAGEYIHDDANNKKQGVKLRQLVHFAWPCLLSKNCFDPISKYHGHLLLSHIIRKFSISKSIIIHVFISLMQAHTTETKQVVKEALDILIPIFPHRMENGYSKLAQLTRKVLIEESHSRFSLLHCLQFVVKHFKIYYSVRHYLIPILVNSIKKITEISNTENKKLAIDIVEMIVEWEIQERNEETNIIDVVGIESTKIFDEGSSGFKRIVLQNNTPIFMTMEPQSMKRVENFYIDKILYFIFKLACEVHDVNTLQGVIEEQLVKRSANILKRIFIFDIWSQDGNNVDFRWLDNILSESNCEKIYKVLELLAFILRGLNEKAIFYIFKNLENGLSLCLLSDDKKILKLMQEILIKLMCVFPIDPIVSTISGEKMKILYKSVRQVLYTRLIAFENNEASLESLAPCLMMAKAVYTNNVNYLDPLIKNIVNVFQKIVRFHLAGVRKDETELFISLDLLSNRIGMMSSNIRQLFLNSLSVLIENTSSVQIIKTILKIFNYWIKDDSENQDSINQKSSLFITMRKTINQHFSDDLELKNSFLEIIYLIYENKKYQRISKLTSDLEVVFLDGLRSSQPEIRMKFFSIINACVKHTLKDRLEYIISSFNWQLMGPHYWIKQCIEFLLIVADPTTRIQVTMKDILLPSVNNFINLMEKEDLVTISDLNLSDLNKVLTKLESNVSFLNLDSTVDLLTLESNVDPLKLNSSIDLSKLDTSLDLLNVDSNLDLFNLYPNFDLSNLEMNLDLSHCDLNVNLLDFDLNSTILNSNVNLTNLETSNLPKNNTSAREINSELNEMISKHMEFLNYLKNIRTEVFVSATIHLCHMKTSLATEVWKEIFPKIWTGQVDVLSFICDKIHFVQKDCQSSAMITFCEALVDCKPKILIRPKIMNYLGKTYNLWHQMTLNLEQMIKENQFHQENFDYFNFDESETNSIQQEILDSLADMYNRLGEDDMWSGLWKKHTFFKETLDATAFEQQGFLDKAQETYNMAVGKFRGDDFTFTRQMKNESNRWEKRWIHCAKELNQWDLLLNSGMKNAINDAMFILEICFQTSNWSTMKEYLDHLNEIPSDQHWKIDLYRGYLSIYGDEKNLQFIDDYAINATKLCIHEWRKLPYIVGGAHLPLLQAAEKIIDLNEAKFIHQNLEVNRLVNLKKIINTWTHRLPTIADDLSHWSNILTWREYQYKSVIDFSYLLAEENISKNYIHTWAQSVNTFSKIARKQNLSSVALDSLTRIHKVKSVSIVDCFERIKQQVKCYLKMYSMGEMNRLQNALVCMESTETQYFKKEIISDFHSLKGKLYTLLGESNEANKVFSFSIEKNEKNAKAWGLWGEYFENVFQTDTSKIEYTKTAVSCFLNAIKYSSSESKCRKYIAKILWFFNYDDEGMNLFKLVNEHAMEIYPIHWVSWIPQLLKWLIRPPGGEILDLLNVISKMFPQAMYSQVRTLYVKLRFKKLKVNKKKIIPLNENDEKHRFDDKVLESMLKCSRIMRKLIIIHPKLISYLERTFDQITKLRENWLHEILKQMQEILMISYRVAFDNKENISEARVTSQILTILRKLIANVRVEVGKIANHCNINARQNPIFFKLNKEFEQDFNLVNKSDKLILNLIKRLKKWIVILENGTKSSLRSFLLEKKCHNLANFNFEIAKIGLPGSTLLPKFSHYHVTIVKFLPWVDVIRHKFSIAHRIWILGNDGKLYPYLIVKNDHFADDNNCRVLQLLEMLNLNLKKQKETCRRFLQFTIQKMIPLHPQIQLIEDNPNAINFMEIFKQSCDKKRILHYDPISKYYDLILSVEARCAGLNRENLKSIFNEVQKNLVPKTILKDWAVMTFPSSTDYWTFRKMFISQISVIIFSQYVFHLTKLHPDMMNLNLDTGLINVNYFTFDLGQISGNLNANELVPFRLTPNIAEFVTDIGISGPLTENLIASSRCLAQPSYQIKSILHAIIRDEFIDDHINQQDDKTFVEKNKEIIRRVTKIVTSISTRLNSLGHFSGIDSNVRNLLNSSRNIDNLCQMDPSWYPWL